MILDKNFNFAVQQALTGTSDVVSSNVLDLTTARKLFEGGGGGKLLITQIASGGTTPTLSARLVGADNAALTSNPIILAQTGVSDAIVAADLPRQLEVVPVLQTTAKRFYGVIFLQGGTSPTATVNAQIVADSQTNLIK